MTTTTSTKMIFSTKAFKNNTDKQNIGNDDKEIVLDSIDGLVKSAEIQPKVFVNNSMSIKQSLSCELNNPCRHGTCFINGTEIACKCDHGYMGPYCDLMRHPCDFKVIFYF